jgi:hypothetical protein
MIELIQSELIPTSKLLLNSGQLEGVPKNPRFIRTTRYQALKRSITDDTEFLAYRELIVYPYNDKFVVLGGNMRLRACKELRITEIPCKVVPLGTAAATLRAYAMKDNIGFGEDDTEELGNFWDSDELEGFGYETPQSKEKDEDNTKSEKSKCPTCGQGIDKDTPF